MERVREGLWLCRSCDPDRFRSTADEPRIGRERSFLVVFFLSLVTLGLYFLYYQFVVFRDVDRASNRRHHWQLYVGHVAFLTAFLVGGAWLVATSLSNPPEDFAVPSWLGAFVVVSSSFLALYLYLEMRRFEGPWEAPMQSPLILPLLVLAQAALGQADSKGMGIELLSLLLFVAQVVLYWMMNTSINAWWRQYWSEKPVSPQETPLSAPT